MAKPLENYVEVSERITLFYEKYPEGSLRCKSVYPVEVNGEHFLVYIAQAFRTADDQAPAEGSAWEPVPGKTNFTRDSELMNAETSAWGRAIAALGFEVKRGIASRQEVQNRRDIGGNGAAAPPEAAGSPHLSAPSAVPSDAATPQEKAALSWKMNTLGIPSSTQRQIVHKLAGDPPKTEGLKYIKSLLSDPSALFREAGVERPASFPDTTDLLTVDEAIGAAPEEMEL